MIQNYRTLQQTLTKFDQIFKSLAQEVEFYFKAKSKVQSTNNDKQAESTSHESKGLDSSNLNSIQRNLFVKIRRNIFKFYWWIAARPQWTKYIKVFWN